MSKTELTRGRFQRTSSIGSSTHHARSASFTQGPEANLTGTQSLSENAVPADTRVMFPAPPWLRTILETRDHIYRWWRRGPRHLRLSDPIRRERIVRWFEGLRPDSLKSRIVTFAIIATLLPSLATAWIAYAQTKRSITDKVTEGLRGASTQVGRELELWMAEVLTDLRVFASSYEVSENLETLTRYGGASVSGGEAARRLNDYLVAVEQRFANYHGLRVVDSEGNTLASSGVASDALPGGWREVFGGGTALIGDPYRDVGSNTNVVAAVAPVKSPRGVTLGALVATIDLESLLPLIQTFVPDDYGALYLLTAQGQGILGYSPLGSPSDRPDDATADLYTQSPDPVEYVTLAGDRRVGALGRVRALSWGVVAELPHDLVYGRITRLRNLTFVIVTFLLAFVATVAYYLAAVIVKPLNRLTEGAAAVASGDLGVDLPVLGGGEVGYLTSVFNDMVARLREGRRQLAAANAALLERNEELAHLSSTDVLTSLYNRRHLMDVLDAETQRADRTRRPYTILMIDVDHFKGFNDQHGHQLGDEMLASVGDLLRRATREMDCAARYGGEEFLVLLPETGLDTAAEVAERIRAQAADIVCSTNGNNVSITVSGGLAEYPAHGSTFEEVIQAADDALYDAKRAGRNRMVAAPIIPHPTPAKCDSRSSR